MMQAQVRIQVLVVTLAALLVGGTIAVMLSSSTAASTVEDVGAPPGPVADPDRDYRSQLEELAETQTPEEVKQIMASGRYVETLFDPERGEYVAAMYVEDPPGIVFPATATAHSTAN